MTEHGLMSELDRLVSEGRNPRTMDIDLLPTIDVLRKINDEDRAVRRGYRSNLLRIEPGQQIERCSFHGLSISELVLTTRPRRAANSV